VGTFEPLVANERLPVAVLAAVGANSRVRALDAPAIRVRGKVCPVMVKPEPLSAASETVRLVLPALVRRRACVPLVPTSTSPKVTALGFAESVAGLVSPTQPEFAAAKAIAENAKKKDVDRPRRFKRRAPTCEHTHPFNLVCTHSPA